LRHEACLYTGLHRSSDDITSKTTVKCQGW